MEIRSIGVVGSGTMGNGIAHVAAQFGHAVVLNDLEERFLARARETITKNLQRGVDKGKMVAAEKEAVLSRIRTTTRFEDLAACDLVIEAVVENLAIKQDVFRRLDQLTRPGTILATNTSSISITKIGAATKRADRVIGMHFMNPVPVMKLVEVIRGLETSDATCADVITLSQRLGKTPVEVNDFPGFVSNRVLLPLINEAVFALAEGVGTPQAIDTVMKLGMNHPMGPLELADFIGLDVCLDIMGVLHEGYGDPKYRACPLLRKMVDAGRLGRKSGRGFYRYDQAS
jgi:3-hydroxybutyryl-CoA dehydrogenase